mgnify:FL=1|jgi:hypothetical protein
MQLQLGIGQEVSIHNVKSVSVEETTEYASYSQKNKYFKTIYIKTEAGDKIEITLFSSDRDVLEYQDQ